VHRDQAFDHLALSFSNERQIGSGLAGRQSKMVAVMNEMRNCGLQISFLLGRQFTFGPRVSNPAPLGDCCFFSGLREVPRQILSALTAADNDVSVLFRAHIDSVNSSLQAASRIFFC
jgi:hypothetical protein